MLDADRIEHVVRFASWRQLNQLFALGREVRRVDRLATLGIKELVHLDPIPLL